MVCSALLTTAVAAGWVSSPMSWSPDARWLSYTVAPDPGPVERAPGWLFDASRGGAGRDRDGRGDRPAKADRRRRDLPDLGEPAGRRDVGADRGIGLALDGADVEPAGAGRWPSAGSCPSRSTRNGRSPSGRFEVVIQDGLDRKRTLLSVPGFELDDAARDRFPHVGPAWSPDGQYLAFPRPGRIPGDPDHQGRFPQGAPDARPCPAAGLVARRHEAGVPPRGRGERLQPPGHGAPRPDVHRAAGRSCRSGGSPPPWPGATTADRSWP